jgi:ferric-dicitrate binding protein FerR (iron transport regulator)
MDLSGEEQENIRESMWPAIQSGIGQAAPAQTAPSGEGRVVRMMPARFLRIAAAACFLLLAGMGLYLLNSGNRPDAYRASLNVPEGYQRFTNEGTAEKSIRLADGSTVMLQPQAALYYPGEFTQSTREVYLKGDAFFSVHRNPSQHFIVHSGEGLLTEVLGTSFHIQQHPGAGNVEVSVVTGKVWVYPQGIKDSSAKVAGGVVLTPNQKAVYHAAKKELLASVADQPALLPGAANRLVFEDVPVRSVLESLEQAYGIKITAESKKLKEFHFTGDITRQGLFQQLDLICQSTGSTYQVEGTTINLKGKGCR